MRRTLVILQVILLLLCSLPVVGVVWSSWFAERHGCTLNEAGVHPCVVNGHDWGPELGAAFLAGWLGLITLPLGALLLVTLALTLLVPPLIRRLRRLR